MIWSRCGVISRRFPEAASERTHVRTHAGDQDDAAAALWDHVARRLTRGEECSVDVDVIQSLDAIEGVAEGVTIRQRGAIYQTEWHAHSKAE